MSHNTKTNYLLFWGFGCCRFSSFTLLGTNGQLPAACVLYTPRAEAGRPAEGEEAVGGGERRFLGCLEFWGLSWVYLAPSRLPPSPSLPSTSSNPLLPLALCALSPLLPLLSPGHSALVSTHNGCSVLTLLTLHSACAPGSGHGRGRERGPGGRVKGWQQLAPCDQNAIKCPLPFFKEHRLTSPIHTDGL